MDHNIIFSKDEKLEEVNDKIADLLSEALYSYIIRKGLLKQRMLTEADTRENLLDKQKQI
jgi:hypothetical protein